MFQVGFQAIEYRGESAGVVVDCTQQFITGLRISIWASTQGVSLLAIV
ncbi:hypothetical protein PV783_32350 [Chitinophaga sp. CC14]